MSTKIMSTSRRSFLKGAAAVGAFNLIPARVLWGDTAPSKQLTRALIGFGGIAHSGNHLGYRGSRLVGLCDPDATHVANGLASAVSLLLLMIRVTDLFSISSCMGISLLCQK